MSDVKNQAQKLELSVFVQNLVKLVPIEFVAMFAVIKGIIPAGTDPVAVWVVFAILAVLVPFYFIFAMKVGDFGQIILTTLAFPIWVFTVGGLPLEALTWYAPWMTSVALALFTLVPPMFLGQRIAVDEINKLNPTPESTASKTDSAARVKSWRQI